MKSACSSTEGGGFVMSRKGELGGYWLPLRGIECGKSIWRSSYVLVPLESIFWGAILLAMLAQIIHQLWKDGLEFF